MLKKLIGWGKKGFNVVMQAFIACGKLIAKALKFVLKKLLAAKNGICNWAKVTMEAFKHFKNNYSIQGALTEERKKNWEKNATKREDKYGKGCKLFNGIRYFIQDRIRYLLDPDYEKAYNRILNRYAKTFIFLYVAITVGWLVNMTRVAFWGKEDVFSWDRYISLMLITAIIHVWRYAIAKNIKSVEKLENIFPNEKEYQDNKLPRLKNLVWPFPFTKNCTGLENFLKILFAFLYWSTIVVSSRACYNLHLFGFGETTGTFWDVGKYFVAALFFIGVFLNYFSYYASVVFCYFLREVANSGVSCEHDVPWNSRYLRDLVHISSRSSMSFLVVSMMYLVTAVVNIIPYVNIDNKHYLIIILGVAAFLCAISYIVVSFLPKLFLNRLFRTWKINSVKEIERKMKKGVTREEKAKYEENITEIWASNMPYVRMEIATAFVAFAIDFSSLVVGVLQIQ